MVAAARDVTNLAAIAGRQPPSRLDLTSPAAPAELVRRALAAEHGRLDVLVNNVGAVRLRLGGFLGTSDEEFAWSMQMNFFSALRATRAALAPMLERGAGANRERRVRERVLRAGRGVLDYGAAKAALVNLTKSLAQEFGAPRHSRQRRLPGPRLRPICGSAKVASRTYRGQGNRHRPRHRAQERAGEHRRPCHRTPHDNRRGGSARRLLASDRSSNTTPARTSSSTADSSRPHDHDAGYDAPEQRTRGQSRAAPPFCSTKRPSSSTT